MDQLIKLISMPAHAGERGYEGSHLCRHDALALEAASLHRIHGLKQQQERQQQQQQHPTTTQKAGTRPGAWVWAYQINKQRKHKTEEGKPGGTSHADPVTRNPTSNKQTTNNKQ